MTGLKPERLEPAVKISEFVGYHQPCAAVDAVIKHVLASLIWAFYVL
nr:MAG TPA: hypothetical protein [Caudoviricetes sp.]